MLNPSYCSYKCVARTLGLGAADLFVLNSALDMASTTAYNADS